MRQSSNGQDTGQVAPQAAPISPDQLEEFALQTLSDLVGVPRSVLSPDYDVTALGLSSAQVMELVYQVEDALGIVLTDGDLAEISTVSELVDLAWRVGRANPDGAS